MKYFVPLKESLIVTDDYSPSESSELVRNIRSDLARLDVDYPVQILRYNLTVAHQLMPPYGL